METDALFGPGLGDSHQSLLLQLKRLGPLTRGDLGRLLGLAPATVREHLQSLAASGLVERHGSRRSRRGRPEVVYRLAKRAEALFPRREAEVLADLARYLGQRGCGELVSEFITAQIASWRSAVLPRVARLQGRERAVEVARIFTEQGYMAVASSDDGVTALRLCHCPIAGLVAVTDAPCRAEAEVAEELLGVALVRTEHLAQGGRSCSYAARGEWVRP